MLTQDCLFKHRFIRNLLLMKFKQITPMVSSVLLPVWYRQSYYPYGIISLITPMVSSVLLPLWYRQS